MLETINMTLMTNSTSIEIIVVGASKNLITFAQRVVESWTVVVVGFESHTLVCLRGRQESFH